MSDREMLELAAKAAGYAISGKPGDWYGIDCNGDCVTFDPLTDDGDALRLAVKLRLNVNFEEWDGAEYACAAPCDSYQKQVEVIDDDKNAATRLAIFRAAVAVGRAMP